ncbi:MAG: serine O-acetyltransferase [Christensenellales bacterium]
MEQHDRTLIGEIADQLERLQPAPSVPGSQGQPLLPDRREVVRLLRDMQTLLFPRFFPHPRGDQPRELLEAVQRRLMEQVALALPFDRDFGCDASCVGGRFITRLPDIKALLLKDAEAIYLGDPAARNIEEIILCYPGFHATLVYRLAHELYRLHVPLIPRMMTEHSHEKTGIDIHAGASIGEHFCIDHGTGVVIGETAVIGDHVKLYQGVTIGAKSFELDEQGHPVKGTKRHPDIGHHVVIYSGATILGGDTVIGSHCIIGGSVWLTSSVPDNTLVFYNGSATERRPVSV